MLCVNEVVCVLMKLCVLLMKLCGSVTVCVSVSVCVYFGDGGLNERLLPGNGYLLSAHAQPPKRGAAHPPD